MASPAKKRQKRSIAVSRRDHTTRLGNDEFFDVFCVLSRDELEKLQITWRRFRIFVGEKMTKVCLRQILEASFVRCDTFRGGAGVGTTSKSWPVSSGPGFVVKLTSLMEDDVSLPGIAESEVTRRLPQYFQHSVIENFSLKCELGPVNKTFGAGLVSAFAKVFESARVDNIASFERLHFGASSSLRSLMECFEEFGPAKVHIDTCQGTRLADDDLLHLRDQGTQSISISTPGELETRLTGDTLSPAGVIQFCFHGENRRRSFYTEGDYTLAHRLYPSFVEELVQESRACLRTDHVRIELNTVEEDGDLDTSMFQDNVVEFAERELHFPEDDIHVFLPLEDYGVLRFVFKYYGI